MTAISQPQAGEMTSGSFAVDVGTPIFSLRIGIAGELLPWPGLCVDSIFLSLTIMRLFELLWDYVREISAGF